MPQEHNLNTDIFEVRQSSPANPAAGVQLSWPCPDRTRVHILSIDFRYAVANAGAARLVIVAAYDGTDNWGHSPLADTVGINANKDCSFALGVDARDHETAMNRLSGKLSSSLILNPGDSLVTLIDAMDATDQLSLIHIRYKRWITQA